jgi:hypothetical protein
MASPDPARDRVDAETILALSRVGKLPMTPERAAFLCGRLEGFLAFAEGWEDLGLAFSFEDGRFEYAPSLAQFRPEWDRATGLNKMRTVGTVVSVEEDAGDDG